MMVPRPEVVVARRRHAAGGVPAGKVLDSPYTRYPVYRETPEHIIGVLHLRDLLNAMNDRGIAGVRDRGDPAAALHRPRDEGHRRPAHRVPADEPAHGDRRRRVRRHGGDRHARGRDRGDRRRDRGRVRPAGRVDRAARRADGSASTAPSRSTTSTSSSALGCRSRTTTRWAATSSACSAAHRSRVTRSRTDGLRFTVVDVEGTRIERLEVEFLPSPSSKEPSEQRAAEA